MGDYIQGRNWLSKAEKHCCLGVACVLAAKEGIIATTTIENGILKFDGESSVLPKKVTKWLGLADCEGYHRAENQYLPHTLSGLNDQGVTFSEIANLIESEPQGMFRK